MKTKKSAVQSNVLSVLLQTHDVPCGLKKATTTEKGFVMSTILNSLHNFKVLFMNMKKAEPPKTTSADDSKY